jgi:predicted PurR-regulated permease PerM
MVPAIARRSTLRDALVRLERGASAARFLALLSMVGALWWAQTVLIPVVVSILVSYALEPAVARLKAWHCPRSIGVFLVMVGLIASIAGTAYGLRGQAVAFSSRLPDAAHQIAQAITHRQSDATGPVANIQAAATELENAAATNRPAKAAGSVPSVRIEEPTFRWSDWLWQGSHGVAELAGQLLAVTFLVYYLLAAGDLYKRKLARIVGPSLSEKRNAVEILAEIDRQVARFLWARTVISVFVGVTIWIGFLMLGLEDAGVWGVISGVVFAVPITAALKTICERVDGMEAFAELLKE